MVNGQLTPAAQRDDPRPAKGVCLAPPDLTLHTFARPRHAHTHAHTRPCTHTAKMHTVLEVYKHTVMHVFCMHTRSHAHVHTRTHTHAHSLAGWQAMSAVQHYTEARNTGW